MENVILFPRSNESLLLYSIKTMKKIAGWEPGGLTQDTFQRIKDLGTGQLFSAVSRLTLESFTIDAQQVNPPDMVLRMIGVEQTTGKIVITPTEGTQFNMDAIEYIARFSNDQTVFPLDAIRNDSGEQAIFADVYIGLKLIDSAGHTAIVYIVNMPLDDHEQIDGRQSGVIVEDTLNGEIKRVFYAYSDGQIKTPRVTGLFRITTS